MAALPITKLAALLIKTLAKPMAKSLKESAKNHASVSSLLVSIGEVSHQATARLSIVSTHGLRVKKIPSLDTNKALDRGADIFGEGIILGVASGILVFEYTTSATKTKKKEETKMAELDAIDEDLQTRLSVLELRCAKLEQKIRILGGVEAVDVEEVRKEVKKKKAPVTAQPMNTSVPSSDQIDRRIQAARDLLLRRRGEGERETSEIDKVEKFEVKPEKAGEESKAGWGTWLGSWVPRSKS